MRPSLTFVEDIRILLTQVVIANDGKSGSPIYYKSAVGACRLPSFPHLYPTNPTQLPPKVISFCSDILRKGKIACAY